MSDTEILLDSINYLRLDAFGILSVYTDMADNSDFEVIHTFERLNNGYSKATVLSHTVFNIVVLLAMDRNETAKKLCDCIAKNYNVTTDEVKEAIRRIIENEEAKDYIEKGSAQFQEWLKKQGE